MAGTVENKLKELGIALKSPPAPMANYVPFVRTGNLLTISGQICLGEDGKLVAKGRLGADVSLEDGQKAARACAVNILAQVKAAVGKRVTVIDYPDGRLAIRYRGIELAYRTFDKIQQVDQGAIVENKRLGAALAFIREEQLRREPERRSGPRRRDQRDARLFKVG